MRSSIGFQPAGSRRLDRLMAADSMSSRLHGPGPRSRLYVLGLIVGKQALGAELPLNLFLHLGQDHRLLLHRHGRALAVLGRRDGHLHRAWECSILRSKLRARRISTSEPGASRPRSYLEMAVWLTSALAASSRRLQPALARPALMRSPMVFTPLSLPSSCQSWFTLCHI